MLEPRHLGRLLIAAGVCTLCASYALAEPAQLRDGDRAWMEKVAEADVAEIAAGKLAAAKSGNAQVRAYAEKMVADHSKNIADLRAIALRKGITLPGEPATAHQKALDRLQKFKGPQFDEQYIHNAGVRDHKAAVKLFKKGSTGLTDADIKAFAQNNLPAVQHHYDLALALDRGAQQ
jgi:putative membrane protein